MPKGQGSDLIDNDPLITRDDIESNSSEMMETDPTDDLCTWNEFASKPLTHPASFTFERLCEDIEFFRSTGTHLEAQIASLNASLFALENCPILCEGKLLSLDHLNKMVPLQGLLQIRMQLIRELVNNFLDPAAQKAQAEKPFTAFDEGSIISYLNRSILSATSHGSKISNTAFYTFSLDKLPPHLRPDDEIFLYVGLLNDIDSLTNLIEKARNDFDDFVKKTKTAEPNDPYFEASQFVHEFIQFIAKKYHLDFDNLLKKLRSPALKHFNEIMLQELKKAISQEMTLYQPQAFVQADFRSHNLFFKRSSPITVDLFLKFEILLGSGFPFNRYSITNQLSERFNKTFKCKKNALNLISALLKDWFVTHRINKMLFDIFQAKPDTSTIISQNKRDILCSLLTELLQIAYPGLLPKHQGLITKHLGKHPESIINFYKVLKSKPHFSPAISSGLETSPLTDYDVLQAAALDSARRWFLENISLSFQLEYFANINPAHADIKSRTSTMLFNPLFNNSSRE